MIKITKIIITIKMANNNNKNPMIINLNKILFNLIMINKIHLAF